MRLPAASFLLLGLLATAMPAAAQSGAKAAPDDLSDAQVAHVAVTANTIDIELGQVAEARAASDAVRQFARAMVAAHTSVNEQAAALAKRLGVVPADNGVSASLLQGAAEASGKLEKLEGATFDVGYIEREVAYHKAVLDALDGLLIPTTENGELKELLGQARAAVAGHLEHARHVRSTLEAGR